MFTYIYIAQLGLLAACRTLAQVLCDLKLYIFLWCIQQHSKHRVPRREWDTADLTSFTITALPCAFLIIFACTQLTSKRMKSNKDSHSSFLLSTLESW